MKTSRRKFLSSASASSLALMGLTSFSYKQSLDVLKSKLRRKENVSPGELATDEDFWGMIREAYTVSPSIINLNNGGVSPQPVHVQEMQYKYIQMSNEAPSYFMWRTLDMGREPLRQKLADMAGCSSEELAICRNATEALDVCIYGIDLKAGDEVILTKQDYPNMINAWKLREKREGIKLVWLNFELPQENDEYFVNAFANAVTSRTKVVHVTHIINWMGQIQPIRKISDAVKKIDPDIEVISDSAHAFGQFDFKIPDLGCDYWGTSLHKWLCAPFGTGLLWVKKEKIASLWPIFANDDPKSGDIRKFEAQGTRSFPAEHAVGYALDFHNMIGTQRKEARLRYLKDYWSLKVKEIPKVKINTSFKPEYACAIGGVSVEGIESTALDTFLFSKYKIHAVAINWENIHCVRVTPHVYTTLKELDKLVKAIEDAAKNGTG